jgi:uncharacterized membrane protein required for colicin V production
MALAITIGSVLLLVVLGLLGLWRGVPRGLMTLACTLLGAVMVDLWLEPWRRWLVERFRTENPGTTAWLAATLAFLGVALIIGYGSGALLPRPRADQAAPKPRLKVLERPLGALLGVLNASLILGYLLRYAGELLRNEALLDALQSQPLLRALSQWLPWFILAVVLSMGALVLARATTRGLRLLTSRQPLPAKPPVPVPPSTQVAAAPNQSAKLSAVSNKIDQALGEPPRK